MSLLQTFEFRMSSLAIFYIWIPMSPLQTIDSDCHRSKHLNSECHHSKRLNSECNHSNHVNSECHHFKHLNSESYLFKHLNCECHHLESMISDVITPNISTQNFLTQNIFIQNEGVSTIWIFFAREIELFLCNCEIKMHKTSSSFTVLFLSYLHGKGAL